MVSRKLIRLGIIDYQVNNLKSLSSSLDRANLPFEIVTSYKQLSNFDRIILPGVGSFSSGMKSLQKNHWVESIQEYALTGRKILGICLGMQILFDSGFENGTTNGLGLIPGTVTSFIPEKNLPTPHIGWNTLHHQKSHKILDGIPNNLDYYFVHSYYCNPSSKSCTIGYTNYGIDFPSVVAQENIVGVQFHPEKSFPSGLRMLKNFYDWN